jgi:hypothetical protein
MRQTSQRNKADAQFLLIAGMLVILLGVPTVYSLIKEPTENSSVVVHSASNSGRRPASYELDMEDGFNVSIKKDPNFKEDLQARGPALVEFNCAKKDIQKEVDSGHIRITGSPCKPTDKLTVLNKSNGFSASVIFTKNQKFTTDFIDLKEGENSFEITTIAKDGSQQTRYMKVMRRLPATASSSIK